MAENGLGGPDSGSHSAVPRAVPQAAPRTASRALPPSAPTVSAGTAARASLAVTADEGIAELYAGHWHRLVRLAWLLLRDQLAAEDVVQDAFVATHRNWAAIRDGGRVVGYLQTAVVNGCRSAQRHNVVVDRQNARDAAAADVPGRASHDSAEAKVMDAVERTEMISALGTLPTRQREVLVLRYYADLSEAQIAHALEISAGTVKAHAHRGLASLRTSMGRRRDPDPQSTTRPDPTEQS